MEPFETVIGEGDNKETVQNKEYMEPQAGTTFEQMTEPLTDEEKLILDAYLDRGMISDITEIEGFSRYAAKKEIKNILKKVENNLHIS